MRPRIKVGVLVASTNPKQQSCAQSVVIAHYYRPNGKRVKRVVVAQENLELFCSTHNQPISVYENRNNSFRTKY